MRKPRAGRSSSSTCPERIEIAHQPVIIAHRGASGYLPEHTLAAKALAYGLGADFLEQDVVATRDHELVVLHDLILDDISDVADRFQGRERSDGHYYVADFDLQEIRELELHERRRPGSAELRFPGRFPLGSSSFRVLTLDDELELVSHLNRCTQLNVGVYPEIKHPQWHRQQGIDLSRLLVETMARRGYTRPDQPAFIQCFDSRELERVRVELGVSLRLVQLLDSNDLIDRDSLPRQLGRIAAYADGIGLPYESLLKRSDGPLEAATLAADVKRAGLLLHPYTFRADALPGGRAELATLLEFCFAELRVDGVFCDHPDVAVAVRNRRADGGLQQA